MGKLRYIGSFPCFIVCGRARCGPSCDSTPPGGRGSLLDATFDGSNRPTQSPDRRRPLAGLSTDRLRRRDETGAVGTVYAHPARSSGPLAPARLGPGRSMATLGWVLSSQSRRRRAMGVPPAAARTVGDPLRPPFPEAQDPAHLIQPHRAVSRAVRELGLVFGAHPSRKGDRKRL